MPNVIDPGPELVSLAAEPEPFTALPWPGAAAIIRRDTSDWCQSIGLFLMHELPFELRHFLEFARDALTEAAYACRERGPENGAEQGDRDDLPGSWRAW